MNQDVFSTRRFTIPAGANNIRLPISGATLRYLDGAQPLRFKLIRDALNEEIDMRPGMARIFRDGLGFVVVDVYRHPDFQDSTEPLSFEIGYGWGYVQDNRAVADIKATVAAPAMSLPAPLQWRFVPKIAYSIEGERHKWTEQPGMSATYTEADAFVDDGHKCICVAMANPRVTKRRVTTNSAGEFFLSSAPSAFGGDGAGGDLTRYLDGVIGETLEIDGGSAIFMNADAGMGAGGLIIEEWFTPETVTLPSSLASWPDDLAPAQWSKNTP